MKETNNWNDWFVNESCINESEHQMSWRFSASVAWTEVRWWLFLFCRWKPFWQSIWIWFYIPESRGCLQGVFWWKGPIFIWLLWWVFDIWMWLCVYVEIENSEICVGNKTCWPFPVLLSLSVKDAIMGFLSVGLLYFLKPPCPFAFCLPFICRDGVHRSLPLQAYWFRIISTEVI